MRKERAAIVAGVLNHLQPVEEYFDLTLTSLSALTGHLPLAHRTARLGFDVSHDAIAAFTDAQVLLIAARAKIVAGHQALGETRNTFFPEVADGGLGSKKPPQGISDRVPARLTVAR